MKYPSRSRCLRAAAVCLATLMWLGATRAQQAPPAPASPVAPGTAVMVFVSYHSGTLPPEAPAQLRETGRRLLAAALEASGHGVVPPSEVEPLLRTWRVRTSGSLSRGFLDAIASQLSADTLVLAELGVFADRVLLAARTMRCDSGHLIRAGIVEERIAGRAGRGEESPSSVWISAIEKASRRLAAHWSGPAPVEDATALLVLPVMSVGAGSWQDDAATICLLRALLADRRWLIPDPALVVGSLQSAGVDPTMLGSEGREVLGRAFGNAPLLLTELVSFELQAPSRAGSFDDFYELGEPSPARDTHRPLYFSMLAVDVASGTVLYGSAQHVGGEAQRGLFAISRDPLLFRRLEEKADRLARSLGRNWGG